MLKSFKKSIFILQLPLEISSTRKYINAKEFLSSRLIQSNYTRYFVEVVIGECWYIRLKHMEKS